MENEKIIQLKKCPFCGGDPVMVGGTRNGRKEVRFIECMKCEAHGEKFEDKINVAACEEKAKSAWNTRN